MKGGIKQILLFFFCVISTNTFAQVISTYAGGGIDTLDNIPATQASLSSFAGIAIDSSGNVYIADGNRNKIKKVDKLTGLISTFAGTGTAAFSGDNGPALSAEMFQPTALAFDKYNNLYIADADNNRVRKVDLVTGIITTIAGKGTQGFSGDNGPATLAELKVPQGITVDALGNVYISDEGNSRIRKIDANGIITTVAGTGVQGFNGDNIPAIIAQLNYALGICTDTANNLYIADWSNYRVRKVDHTTGIITTVAGNGNHTYNGENLPATMASTEPIDVTFDNHNNMYIADFHNNRIRKVDASGTVFTIAGNGVGAFGGDSGPADSAQIHGPEGVKVDPCGNVYIADFGNKRVRKVTYMPVCNPAGVAEVGAANSIGIYPNPVSDMLTITSSSIINEVILVNVLGQALIKQNPRTNKEVLDVTTVQSGVYFVRVINRLGEVLVRRFIKL